MLFDEFWQPRGSLNVPENIEKINMKILSKHLPSIYLGNTPTIASFSDVQEDTRRSYMRP
jgi:hypothetical protein